MPLKIINPIEYPNWNELLLTNKESSFFHTSNWAKVLSESYKYKPVYFTSIDEKGKLTELTPFMEINSVITGIKGVSLPFSDYCQPIEYDKIHSQKILEKTIEYGKRAGWKHIEWRWENRSLHKDDASSFYYVHYLDLTEDEKSLLASFRNSTRRNINKAIKEGVHAKILTSFESIKVFYSLHCMTRKHHGLPPQPFYFFKKIFDHILSKGKGIVVLASYHNVTIAGAIYFYFGNKGLYKYGASDRRYQHLRPNNLIMWKAIKWQIKKGIKTFSLGITEPENKGLLQFKRGWGGNEHILHYHMYNIPKACFEKDSFRKKIPTTLFKHLPSPVLNFIGYLSYRHMA